MELLIESKDSKTNNIQDLLQNVLNSLSHDNFQDIIIEFDDLYHVLCENNPKIYNDSSLYLSFMDIQSRIIHYDDINTQINRPKLLNKFWKCVNCVISYQPIIEMTVILPLLSNAIQQIDNSSNDEINIDLLEYCINLICFCSCLDPIPLHQLNTHNILVKYINSTRVNIVKSIILTLTNIAAIDNHININITSNDIVNNILPKYNDDHEFILSCIILLGYINNDIKLSLDYLKNSINNSLILLDDAVKCVHRANPPTLTQINNKAAAAATPLHPVVTTWETRSKSTRLHDETIKKPEFESFKRRQKALVNNATLELLEHRTLRDSLAPLTPITSVDNNIDLSTKNVMTILPNEDSAEKLRIVCRQQIPLLSCCIEAIGRIVQKKTIITCENILNNNLLDIMFRILAHVALNEYFKFMTQCLNVISVTLKRFHQFKPNNIEEYKQLSKQMNNNIDILARVTINSTNVNIYTSLVHCLIVWLQVYYHDNEEENENKKNENVDEEEEEEKKKNMNSSAWRVIEPLRKEWDKSNMKILPTWKKLCDESFENIQKKFMKKIIPNIVKNVNKYLRQYPILAEETLRLISFCCSVDETLTLATIRCGCYETLVELIGLYADISNEEQQQKQSFDNIKQNNYTITSIPTSTPTNKSTTSSITPTSRFQHQRSLTISNVSNNNTRDSTDSVFTFTSQQSQQRSISPGEIEMDNGDMEPPPSISIPLPVSQTPHSFQLLCRSLRILSCMLDVSYGNNKATLLLVNSGAARRCWKCMEMYMTDDEILLLALKNLCKLLNLPTLLNHQLVNRSDVTKRFRQNRTNRHQLLADDNVGLRPFLTIVEDMTKLLCGYSGDTNLRVVRCVPTNRSRKTTIVLALATSSFRSSAPLSTFELLNRKSPELQTPRRHVRSQTITQFNNNNNNNNSKLLNTTLSNSTSNTRLRGATTIVNTSTPDMTTTPTISPSVDNNNNNNNDWSNNDIITTDDINNNIDDDEINNNDDNNSNIRMQALSPFEWNENNENNSRITTTSRLVIVAARFVLAFIRALSTTLSLQEPLDVRAPHDRLHILDYALFLSLAPPSSFADNCDLAINSIYSCADIMEFIQSYIDKCHQEGEEVLFTVKLLNLLKSEIICAMDGLRYLLCGTQHLRINDERNMRRAIAFFKMKARIYAHDSQWREVLARKYEIHYLQLRYHEISNKLNRSRSHSQMSNNELTSTKRHENKRENIRESMAASTLSLPLDAQLELYERKKLEIWNENFENYSITTNDHIDTLSLNNEQILHIIEMYDEINELNTTTTTTKSRPMLRRATSLNTYQANNNSNNNNNKERGGSTSASSSSSNLYRSNDGRKKWIEFLSSHIDTCDDNNDNQTLDTCDDNIIYNNDNNNNNDDDDMKMLNDKWSEALLCVECLDNGHRKALQDIIDDEELLLYSSTIPIEYRSRAWIILSGAFEERRKWPKHYYKKLVHFVEGTDNYTLLWRDEIRKDVHRTLPDESLFQTDEGKSALERILSSYVLRNPETVGYCQSMNLLAATLLTQMSNEEDAFWVFVCMIESRIGYYNRSMCGLKVDQRVLEDVVRFTEPEIADKFNEVEISLSTFTVSWLLCLFVESPLNVNDAVNIWDLLFIFGDELLFSMALTLLRTKRNEILNLKSGEELLYYFLHGGIGNKFPLSQVLINMSRNCGRNSILHQINELRQFHRLTVLEENQNMDTAAAQHIATKFRFRNEKYVQHMWQKFLSPSPWNILLQGGINNIMWFHRAFCPIAFPSWNRHMWRDNGIFAGVIERLFVTLDSSCTGSISFDEFCTGIYILEKGSRQERSALAYQFCDIDDDGRLSLKDLTESYTMLHEMYSGRSGGDSDLATKDGALFANYAFNRVGRLGMEENFLNEQENNIVNDDDFIDFDAFCIISGGHPLLDLFFGISNSIVDKDGFSAVEVLKSYFSKKSTTK